MALSVVAARLPIGDVPVCGVTLEPYIQLRRLDTNATATAEEIPEEGSETEQNGRYVLRSSWSRSVIQGRGTHYCSIHPELEASVQCTLCLRLKHAIPTHKSYHCSAKCLSQNWRLHKEMHQKAGESSLAGRFAGIKEYDSNGFKGATYSNGGETWQEVGRSRLYTPSADDVGLCLRYECSIIDTMTGRVEISKGSPLTTARVRPAPNPPRRELVSIIAPEMRPAYNGTFTMLTYNVLADLYASAEMHDHCPSWALAWSYRKQNLLRELLSYNADIMCLQEVQSDHYADFLAPELQRAGYTPIYKKKTTEMFNKNAFVMDGCATFFRRDKFSLVKKYEVEFNKAALSLSETLPASAQKKAALARLLKNNVALIAVLEAVQTESSPMGRQLICVANTHIHANPELSDVKLWQVHTLLKGLEKIAASAAIPMLVAGDFNSLPGSAAHQLLVNRAIDPSNPDLENDPLNINKPVSKLTHQLCLASAYSGYMHAQETSEVLKQMERMDTENHEPLFSYNGKDLKGTLDYILYTTDALMPVALMELPTEDELKERTVGGKLPCSDLSSDHIALMAEFMYLPHGS